MRFHWPRKSRLSLFQEYFEAPITAFFDIINYLGGQLVLAVNFDRDIQPGSTRAPDHSNDG